MKSFIAAALALGMASADVQRLPQTMNEHMLMPRQTAACNNTATSRSCWGDFNTDTNYYLETPDTGVTREYWLTLESIDCAPDGYQRKCMAFNGTVPGPTIIADWGDNLIIHVTNNLPTNGTSVHWHGLRQLGTANADGVPGVTECPIVPGGTKTYEMRATQYGSSWYHSHWSLQYAEGAVGAMIFNGPTTADYDEDLGVMMLTDWSHTPAFDLWPSVRFGGPPSMETGLINGTNTFACSADDVRCVGGAQKWSGVFEAGKKYKLRVVNAGTDSHFQFSIDGHNLTVVANDFVPLVPYTTEAVGIAIGQRYDVIIEANAAPGDYWLRAQWNSACAANQNPDNITGIIRYDAASTADPTTVTTVTKVATCGDEAITDLVPWLALDVGAWNELALQSMNTAIGPEWFQWTLNGSSLELDWENPTIVQIIDGVTEFPIDYNVISVDRTPGATTAEWVVLVIQDDTGFGITHPIHLHGHDFWVLQQETALYSGDTSTFNLVNPPRRDVASLPGNGHLVIAFELDNPGAWIVHCHIAWHASQGLALEFVEDQSLYVIDEAVQTQTLEQCATWNNFMNTTTYTDHPQDDSGI